LFIICLLSIDGQIRMTSHQVVLLIQPRRQLSNGHVASEDDVAVVNTAALDALKRESRLANHYDQVGDERALCIALKPMGDDKVPRWRQKGSVGRKTLILRWRLEDVSSHSKRGRCLQC
jgi:hypothetical protein